MKLFDSYQFKDFVKETIAELKFNEPTKIQKAVMPLVYKNVDVIGISQTGTGKTHAFLIPILEKIDFSAESCGFTRIDFTDSPIEGGDGNREYLALFQRKE